MTRLQSIITLESKLNEFFTNTKVKLFPETTGQIEAFI